MKVSSVALILALLFVVGCSSHIHTIGDGPKSGDMIEARQWYVLWGFVPLNNVDTNVMAAGADDYEIVTELSALDIIISIFTSAVTVYSRTVTVTK